MGWPDWLDSAGRVQLTAAWVRRKRFEAGLLAQALSFAGPRGAAHPVKEPDFWDVVGALPGVQVVNVEAGGNGNTAG